MIISMEFYFVVGVKECKEMVTIINWYFHKENFWHYILNKTLLKFFRIHSNQESSLT